MQQQSTITMNNMMKGTQKTAYKPVVKATKMPVAKGGKGSTQKFNLQVVVQAQPAQQNSRKNFGLSKKVAENPVKLATKGNGSMASVQKSLRKTMGY